MAYQYNGKDIYKQLEQVMIKLDYSLKEIKSLNATISELNATISELKNIILEKDAKIEFLIEENERLKNQINKNSSNSSKPSSTNITTPKKKTGANLYNYRTKSGRKQGGQYGHIGKNLNKKMIEKLIEEEKVKVITIEHTIRGNSKKKDIVKYKLGIEINAYVEKHIFKHNNNVEESLPKEFYTDVTYDNSIKALSIELGAYNVVPYDRLSDFFNIITNNIINISNGTLVNFLVEFSNKSINTINKLEENILNSKIIYTDETGTKLNKKNMYIRNYSNENVVVYKAHKNKGHKPIEEDNILVRFSGGIMHDHDTTNYKYGTKNYECNIHLGRYLEELIQNVLDIKWPGKLKELIFRMNETRKIAISFGLEKFDKEKIIEYETEFKNILLLAKEENKNINSYYYKDKSNKLLNRIKKYQTNHLNFIKDFEIPFDNNMSERDLRMFKTKTKISGGFRSLEMSQHYVNALSIIKTSIKQDINPFTSIKDIFNHKILFV